MSEVKRYTFAGAAGLYVYQADFDAALAREAALQARLTVADQQVDDLQAELTKAREVIGALTKGFNTLDQVGGKYSINMSFAHRDDAWDAYSKLCKFNKLARQSAPAVKIDCGNCAFVDGVCATDCETKKIRAAMKPAAKDVAP